jgi:hypothetical protein
MNELLKEIPPLKDYIRLWGKEQGILLRQLEIRSCKKLEEETELEE